MIFHKIHCCYCSYKDTRRKLISFLLTAWKVSKYGVISGLCFPVFSPNKGKYGPEITRYLDTFHAVSGLNNINLKSYFMYRSSKFGSAVVVVAESLLAAVDGFDGVLP